MLQKEEGAQPILSKEEFTYVELYGAKEEFTTYSISHASIMHPWSVVSSLITKTNKQTNKQTNKNRLYYITVNSYIMKWNCVHEIYVVLATLITDRYGCDPSSVPMNTERSVEMLLWVSLLFVLSLQSTYIII